MVQVRKDTLHALEVGYTVSAIALYMYSVLVILRRHFDRQNTVCNNTPVVQIRQDIKSQPFSEDFILCYFPISWFCS